jgi:RHS repeat-associated protein
VLAFIALTTLSLWADAPTWWAERGVLNTAPGVAADDYAAVNQGQVRNIAKQAYDEMKENGVVDPIAAAASTNPEDPARILYLSWDNPSTSIDDYRAVNIGQLKNVAKPFYDQLVIPYPWSSNGTANDYAMANIGQVKNLFSFSIQSDDDNYFVTIISGNHQTGSNGVELAQPLKVRVTDAQGAVVSNTTVLYTVSGGEGTLARTSGGTGEGSIGVSTTVLGEAVVYLKPAGVPGALTQTSATVASSSVTFASYIKEVVSSPSGNAQVPTAPAAGTPAPGGTPDDLPNFGVGLSEPPDDGTTYVSGFNVIGYVGSDNIPDYSSAVLGWAEEESDIIVVLERRIDHGIWHQITGASSGYTDTGLLAGRLYEYRLIINKDDEIVDRIGPIAYDVPIIKSVKINGHTLYARRHTSGYDVGFSVGYYAPESSWSTSYFCMNASPPNDSGYPESLRYKIDFHNQDGVTAPQAWMETISRRETFYYQNMGHYLEGSAIGMSLKNGTEEQSITTPVVPTDTGDIFTYSVGCTVEISEGSYFLINYRNAIISPHSIPAEGLELSPGEAFEILPLYGADYEGGFIFPEWTNVWAFAWPYYWSRGENIPDLLVAVAGGLMKNGSSKLGREVNTAPADYYDEWMRTPALTTTITMPESGDGGTVTIGGISFAVHTPGGAVPSGTIGVNIPSSEASGAKYRKIALDGAPLSDEKPQQEAETDQAKEETFIDALTLGLRHDTTDVYIPVATADFALSVRRSAVSEVWNLKNGRRPSERPDRPFGAGWTTNLSANIHFAHGIGDSNPDGNSPDTAMVTDENGAEYTFVILYGPDASYTAANGYTGTRTFVPLPGSNHEQSTYLCTLTDNGGGSYTFKRKYGSTLIYVEPGLDMTCPADRINGSASGTKHVYARLSSVTDRYGNGLLYDYTKTNAFTVVPSAIQVRKANGDLGAEISIEQNGYGLITRIWDARRQGIQYHYNYISYDDDQLSDLEPLPYYEELYKVTQVDGRSTDYTYHIVMEEDLHPNEQSRVGNHYHLDLAGITDPLGRTHSFLYVFDQSKYDYSSYADGGYYIKTGLPRQVRQATLPGGSHALFYNESQNLKVQYNVEGDAASMVPGFIRKTRVVDALGHERVYDFGTPHVEELSGFASAYLHHKKFDNPRLVYYTTMTIQTPLGGTESFTFSPEAGMSLVEALDFSDNKTSYTYTDPLESDPENEGPTPTGVYGFYSDPTSQTNALGRTKTFTYGDHRIMTSSTDENGVKTQWTVDSLGRRTAERVFKANSLTEVVQHTVFTYGNTTFPNFMTAKTVKKLGNAADTNVEWVKDLVTLYEPDANGRIAQEAVDMNGNGQIDAATDLVTSYSYDANGNKLTTTDPRGNTTHFSYDLRNRLTHVTYADGHQKRFFYDARGNKTKEIDENSHVTLWEYDALNRVIHQAIDLNGNGVLNKLAGGVVPDRTQDIVTSYSYNALNTKLTTTDPKGTVTKFDYDALQRLTQKTDALGVFNYVTTYEYDLSKNPGGSVFNSSGFKPTKVTDPRGYRTEVTYDGLYRPVIESVEYKTNLYATTNKAYDDVGNLTDVTGPLATLATGGTARMLTKTEYDALRRPFKVTEASGTTDAVTHETVYTSTGLAWKTVADSGTMPTHLKLTTLTDYDAAGRPVKVHAPAVVDALSTSPTPTVPVSPVTETGYDPAGNVSHVINPLGQRTDCAYDTRNRRYEEKLPAVVDATTGVASRPIRTTAYDGVGNMIAVQDARGFITTTDYDRANRPWRVIAPPMTTLDGSTVYPETTSTYDKAGNVLTVTDANNHVTTNTYDALGRLKTTLQEPDADPAHDILVQNEYDSAGNRTEVEDGKNQVTTFDYDGLNRNTKITDPAQKSVTFEYDAVNKTARVDSKNQRTDYGYDVRHRLTHVTYQPTPLASRVSGQTYADRSVDNRIYAYDALSRLETVTEPNKPEAIADVAYSYDALGRQLSETSNRKTHTYGYDLANNRVIVTYGGTGTVLTSGYDAHNRLATLTETQDTGLPSQVSRETTYGYDLNGNRVLQTLPNGEEVDTQYDPLNRAVAITTSKANGSLLLQLLQMHDPVGNLVQLTERHYGSTLKPRTVTNTYDHVNRLTKEVNAEGSTKTIATDYTFDTANNRVKKVVETTTGSTTTSVQTDYAYNTLNQLETMTEGTTETTYTYDLNGNRETRIAGGQTDTYGYDYENRLVGLTKNTAAGTGTYTYVYDYRTRRVERTENATTTQLVFSGGVSVAEYDGAATILSPTVEYIRGSDWGGGVGGLLYSVRSGVPSFKHYNSRGDVISATDSAGAATWQGTYEAYGTRTQEVGTTQDRQKANTKEEDPTGLLNEGFRYRDLETGVFITRDPLGFVDGPNMYAYVVQNPWSKFDPEGLRTKKEHEEIKKKYDEKFQQADAEQREIDKRHADDKSDWSKTADGKRYYHLVGVKAQAQLVSANAQNQIDKIDQTARVISLISKRTVEQEAAELDDESELYSEGRKLVAAGLAAEQVGAYYGGKLAGAALGKAIGKVGGILERRAIQAADGKIVASLEGLSSNELSKLTSAEAKAWLKGTSDAVPSREDMLRLREIARRAVEAGKQSPTNPVQSQRLEKINQALSGN